MGRERKNEIVPVEFARARGLREVRCPSCRGLPGATIACANCGGSGRLWASPNSGTLADAGLSRLRELSTDAGTGFVDLVGADRRGLAQRFALG